MTGLENWPAIFVEFVGARNTVRKKELVAPMVLAQGHGEGRPGRPYVWPLILVAVAGGCERLALGRRRRNNRSLDYDSPPAGDGCFKAKQRCIPQSNLSQSCRDVFTEKGTTALQAINLGNWIGSVYCKQEGGGTSAKDKDMGQTLVPWFTVTLKTDVPLPAALQPPPSGAPNQRIWTEAGAGVSAHYCTCQTNDTVLATETRGASERRLCRKMEVRYNHQCRLARLLLTRYEILLR